MKPRRVAHFPSKTKPLSDRKTLRQIEERLSLLLLLVHHNLEKLRRYQRSR